MSTVKDSQWMFTAERQRKKPKSKPEGAEGAEDTEGKAPGVGVSAT
jgi:hypothetical protein